MSSNESEKLLERAKTHELLAQIYKEKAELLKKVENLNTKIEELEQIPTPPSFNPKKPKKIVLRELLIKTGPAYRADIKKAGILRSGTVDSLLASGEYKQDREGRWYHVEDMEQGLYNKERETHQDTPQE